MGEPRRFKLKAVWKTADIPSWIVCSTPKPAIPPEEICVREDRATEVDREKIALRLAEWGGDGDDYRTGAGGARKQFNDQADELLQIVFGVEASRV